MTILMIIGAVLLRLVPHIPNFAPITALAIFGGAYINKRYAILLPFLAMLISDYLLLYINPYSGADYTRIYPITAMLHATTIYVYASFLISSIIGIWLRNHKTPSLILLTSLFSSVQFFLITNFGSWAGGMYSRGVEGLFQSYLMGLPFFKWTLLSDLFYTTMLFGSYELAKNAANIFRSQAEKIP